MNADALLVAEDLSVYYGPVQAVRGVTLRVAAGQLVTLIGANGAGKTSTLQALCGLVRPRAGRVSFAGENVTGLRTPELVDRGLVLVPEGRAILGRMTVLENLWLGGYRRRDRAALQREVSAALERFPVLGERRHRLASALSGGEQQQLAIARGVLAKPRLLLLDEPSMGLAPQMVRLIFDLIASLREAGVTVLLVEQNARVALAAADYAYVMETGRMILEGAASDLARDPRVQHAYLGGTVS